MTQTWNNYCVVCCKVKCSCRLYSSERGTAKDHMWHVRKQVPGRLATQVRKDQRNRRAKQERSTQCVDQLVQLHCEHVLRCFLDIVVIVKNLLSWCSDPKDIERMFLAHCAPGSAYTLAWAERGHEKETRSCVAASNMYRVSILDLRLTWQHASAYCMFHCHRSNLSHIKKTWKGWKQLHALHILYMIVRDPIKNTLLLIHLKAHCTLMCFVYKFLCTLYSFVKKTGADDKKLNGDAWTLLLHRSIRHLAVASWHWAKYMQRKNLKM